MLPGDGEDKQLIDPGVRPGQQAREADRKTDPRQLHVASREGRSFGRAIFTAASLENGGQSTVDVIAIANGTRPPSSEAMTTTAAAQRTLFKVRIAIGTQLLTLSDDIAAKRRR